MVIAAMLKTLAYKTTAPLQLQGVSLQVEGQLAFFSQQLLPYNQPASQACSAAAQHDSTAQHGQISLSMLRSYRLPKPTTGVPNQTKLCTQTFTHYWVLLNRTIQGKVSSSSCTCLWWKIHMVTWLK